MHSVQSFPSIDVVPVWFHVVPRVPHLWQTLLSPGPDTQEPCGPFVVPCGSIGAPTQKVVILRKGPSTEDVVPVWFHAVPIAASSYFVRALCAQALWFLCGAMWTNCRFNAGRAILRKACLQSMWFLRGSTWFLQRQELMPPRPFAWCTKRGGC